MALSAKMLPLPIDGGSLRTRCGQLIYVPVEHVVFTPLDVRISFAEAAARANRDVLPPPALDSNPLRE